MNTSRVILAALSLSVCALCASENFQKLSRCVDRKDKPCILALLKQAPTEQSAEYLELAARANMLVGQNRQAVEFIPPGSEAQTGEVRIPDGAGLDLSALGRSGFGH